MDKSRRLKRVAMAMACTSLAWFAFPPMKALATRICLPVASHLLGCKDDSSPDAILQTILLINHSLPALEERVVAAGKEWRSEKQRLNQGNPQATERSVAALLKVFEVATATRDIARQRLAALDQQYQEAKNKKSLEQSEMTKRWLQDPIGEVP